LKKNPFAQRFKPANPFQAGPQKNSEDQPPGNNLDQWDQPVPPPDDFHEPGWENSNNWDQDPAL